MLYVKSLNRRQRDLYFKVNCKIHRLAYTALMQETPKWGQVKNRSTQTMSRTELDGSTYPSWHPLLGAAASGALPKANT